jgi:hypothetical protein
MEVTVQEVLILLGEKEVLLSVERGRVHKATEIINAQAARIKELEDAAKGETS